MHTLSLGTGGEPPERTACAGPGRDPEGQRLERNREALWDAELTDDSPLCVLLLGSSALLVQKGLSESLAGRFILFRCPHRGFPGAYSLSGDEPSWGAYVRDSLIETTLAPLPAAPGQRLPACRIGEVPGRPRQDLAWWGRVVENAVGAHLLNSLQGLPWEVTYWRDGDLEVDYVVRTPRRLRAIEVKSSRARRSEGLAAFCARWPEALPLIVGQGGMPLEEFFSADLPAILK